MGIVRKLKDAARWVDNVVEEEAPRPKPDKPQPPPKKKPGEAQLVRGLGERIGFAGIAAFTIGAALVGASGCREGGPQTAPSPTCDEPAAWCHRGDAAEAVQR